MLTGLPERPIDSVEKINEVIECVDTICPDSDDAYEWDSKVMRARHDEVVNLMYLAHNGNEWAVKEIASLTAALSATRAERDEARRERDEWQRRTNVAEPEAYAARDRIRALEGELTTERSLRDAALTRAKAEAVEAAAKVCEAMEQRWRDVQYEAVDRGAQAGDLVALNAAQAKRTARDLAAAIRASLVQP